MSSTMSKTTFEGLIRGDIEWLLKQPWNTERDHIQTLLKQSPELIYERFEWEQRFKENVFDWLKENADIYCCKDALHRPSIDADELVKELKEYLMK